MFFPHRQVRVDPGVYPLHNDVDPNHVDAVPPYKVGHALPAITQPEGRRGGAKATRLHGGGCLGRCFRSQAPRCHIGGGARALKPTAVLGVPAFMVSENCNERMATVDRSQAEVG